MYSGVDFKDVMVCVHKEDKGGRVEICGRTPTASDPSDSNLQKCKEHFGLVGWPKDVATPTEPFPYDEELHFFTDAMKFKLLKNSHKGKWETLDIKSALEQLKSEVAELERAVNFEDNTIAMILEAADVANFALIVSNIAVRRLRDVRA